MSRTLRAALGGLVLAASTVLAVAAPSQAAYPSCTTYKYFSQGTWELAEYPVSAAGSRYCVMGSGSVSNAVKSLQRSINACWYASQGSSYRLTVDGVYGSRTKSAIVAIQRAGGVPADGVYGPQTAKSNAMYFKDKSQPGWCYSDRTW